MTVERFDHITQEASEMTSPGKTWQEAIIEVLDKAEEPLDYNEITRLIGEKELRSLSGATPANTVNSNLTSLTEERRVERIERGLYALPQKAEQYKAD